MYCPHFPKAQRESWFVIICNIANDELLSIKRASPKLIGKKGKVICTLDVPEDLRGQDVTIMCINDAVDIKYTESYTLL